MASAQISRRKYYYLVIGILISAAFVSVIVDVFVAESRKAESDNDNTVNTNENLIPKQRVSDVKKENESKLKVSINGEESSDKSQLEETLFFRGHAQWNDDEWGEFAANHMNGVAVSQVEVGILLNALSNKALSPTTKNNISNWIRNAGVDSKAIKIILRDSILDATEDALWRQYALQQLATFLSEEPEKFYLNVIRDLMLADHSALGGTALLMCYRLSDTIEINQNELIEAIKNGLKNKEAEDLYVMTCISVAAEMQLSECKDTVISLLRRGGGIKRVALRAIGELGVDEKDLMIINRAKMNARPEEIMAINASLIALEEKITKNRNQQ